MRLVAGFDIAALGKVKQIGPDESTSMVPGGGALSPYLWFHFGGGAPGARSAFHVNPAPFSARSVRGNGLRHSVVSEDGESWTGVTENQERDGRR